MNQPAPSNPTPADGWARAAARERGELAAIAAIPEAVELLRSVDASLRRLVELLENQITSTKGKAK